MSEPTHAEPDGEPDGGEESPDYRVSHLMDDIADAYSERGMVQDVAPLQRGGINPRVDNRVSFRYGEGPDVRERSEGVLDTEQFAWTTGDTREIIVLGRAIRDVRELRKGDRIHLNKRRGPFRVYRVSERAPEVLQRSDPAVTVELSNEDTDTDWLMVHWKGERVPMSYCRTKDKHAKGGFRYRKVEDVERMGRVGPLRMYRPANAGIREEMDRVLEMVRDARDADGLGDVHPSDVDRVVNLMTKPASEVFDPADANTVREVMTAVSEFHEREADALTIASEDDREHARRHQSLSGEASEFADAFSLIQMDAVEDTEDTRLYRCEDCGSGFTNKFKFPTHRRDCPARGGEPSE